MKNKVASIAKIYALVNGGAGALLGIWFMVDFDFITGFLLALVVVVMSFFIYCIGEGLQLLQDIKDGTKDTKIAVNNVATAKIDEELPSI